VHHSDPDLAVLTVIFGSALIVTAAVLVLVIRWRQRIYTGPLQQRWHDARRGLTTAQRRQLWWANMRHRPVSQPELGPAQLAYTRYAADTFHRAPMTRHRWIRIVVPASAFAAAAFQLVPALLSPQARTFHLAEGGLFLCCGLLWSYLVIRGLRRAEQKVNTLQQQLQHRYEPRQDVALPPPRHTNRPPHSAAMSTRARHTRRRGTPCPPVPLPHLHKPIPASTAIISRDRPERVGKLPSPPPRRTPAPACDHAAPPAPTLPPRLSAPRPLRRRNRPAFPPHLERHQHRLSRRPPLLFSPKVTTIPSSPISVYRH
jgi:hypothetical protein